MKNILDLDQVCEIANDVYFEVIDHLGLYDDMVHQTENGSENTEQGSQLYYLIEDAVKNAIKYKEEDEEEDDE
jgi:regulator of sigma D